ncbi:carotenoid cleavage dioxygenase 7, chloroplastic [Tanacetum coccineum]|uniref:Carotenoid cleavage dioxygenase 7, chloroplastic n=1 Tax=Tanacetum coccineum TaxID=301880 RepID=A0ABQ5HKP2_9ASTR
MNFNKGLNSLSCWINICEAIGIKLEESNFMCIKLTIYDVAIGTDENISVVKKPPKESSEQLCYLVILDAKKIRETNALVARLEVPRFLNIPLVFHGFRAAADLKMTRDTGHGTRDTGHGTRDTGHGTRDTEHGTRNTEHGTWNPRTPGPDPRNPTPDPRQRNPEPDTKEENQKIGKRNIKHDMESYPSTDIAKISRKRLKPDKHEHGNGIEYARAGRMLSKSYTSPNALIGQFPKGNDTRGLKKTHGEKEICTKTYGKEAQRPLTHGLPRWQSV